MDNIFATAHDAMLESLPPASRCQTLINNNNNNLRNSLSAKHSQDGRRDPSPTHSNDEGSCLGPFRAPSSGAPVVMPDTSVMTVDEILQFVRVPNIVNNESSSDSLSEYLDAHEILHLNHLFKCFTDSIFMVSLPDNTLTKSHISPVDFLHIYSCCVLRIYILYKTLDIKEFSMSEQACLFQNNVLKALFCLSFLVFKEDSDTWHIPSSVSETKSVIVKLSDLNQILPRHLLQQALTINALSTKLQFDQWVTLLCVVAIFYSPIDCAPELSCSSRIDQLRDRYMEILLKYLKYKHGVYNATLIFPEILKLMDAILKHCSQVEKVFIALKSEEVSELEKLVKAPHVFDTKNIEDSFYTGVDFSKINRRIAASIHITSTTSAENFNSPLEDFPPSPCLPIPSLPTEPREAKTRKEVEKLLVQKMMMSTQVKLQQKTPPPQQMAGEDTDLAKNVFPSSFAPPAPPRAMNLLAIQRLLLDLSQKEQARVSPEPPLADEDGLQQQTSEGVSSIAPSVAQLQALQHKLSQVSNLSGFSQSNAHLENFAKSLGQRVASPKDGNDIYGCDSVSSPVAIDLSSRRRHKSCSKSPSPVPATPLTHIPLVVAQQAQNLLRSSPSILHAKDHVMGRPCSPPPPKDCNSLAAQLISKQIEIQKNTNSTDYNPKHAELILDYLGRTRNSDSSGS